MNNNMKFTDGKLVYPKDFDLLPSTSGSVLVCALCGRTHGRYSHSWRMVRKGRDGSLMSSYYRPRLGSDELFVLPEGEQIVCTNRGECHRKMFRIVRLHKRIGARG